MKDKFKTNPVAKKIKAESKVKKATLSPKEKKIKEDYEREWESILLNDKKKALEEWKNKVTNDGYSKQKVYMSLTDKITWVLTAVNVGILISLILK